MSYMLVLVFFKRIWRIVAVVAILLSGLIVNRSVSSGQVQGWSQPINLGTGWFPDIAVDGTGRVHVAWASSIIIGEEGLFSDENVTGYDVVMYSYKQGELAWQETRDIIAMRQGAGSEVTRPALLVDEDGTLHMSYRDIQIYYSQAPAESAIISKEWHAPRRVSETRVGYFSRLAMDSQKRLHLVYTENVYSRDCPICYHVFYRRSDNYGRNWSSRTDISLLPIGSAKPWVLIDDQDAIHVVWEAGRGGGLGQLSDPTAVMYAVSYDGGDTWELPQKFPSPGGTARNVTIGVDGAGRILVTYLSFREDLVYYQVSTDSGRTWSDPEPLPGVSGGWGVYNARLDTYSMATDSAGYLHLVFVGRILGDEKLLNVLHMVWDGSSWSQPSRITTLRGDVPEWPRIAIGTGNQLHVTWFVRDEENIWAADATRYTIWYTRGWSDSSPVEPIAWPTVTPTAVPTEVSVTPIPSPTPIDPSVFATPVSSGAGMDIYSELDEMATMAKGLIPTILFLAVVIIAVRRIRH